MKQKQFALTLNALLVAGKRLTEEKSITALAQWCDKVKDFESLTKVAAKAARSLRKDDSVSLSKRMSVAQLTVGLPTKLKPRKIFAQAMLIAKHQAKRVKTISKSKEIISKHLTK
jgi:hypothetical protein